MPYVLLLWKNGVNLHFSEAVDSHNVMLVNQG